MICTRPRVFSVESGGIDKACVMLCVSVVPESRRLAKVDLLNASMQGDIVEFCLDHLLRTPDVKELISGFEKPIIFSCRRPEQGGCWKGTEEERLKLLREAIVAEPTYVELELDIAADIPRFGKTKRIISIHGQGWSLKQWESAYNEAVNKNADVVKCSTSAQTLDQAWPLLAMLTRKHQVPVLPVVEGAAGLMFTLLARKYGSPWGYAALEQGMEAFPGQPTIWDLKDVYDFEAINSKTRFTGLIGFGASQKIGTWTLNSCFKKLDIQLQCLPCPVGHHLDNLEKQLQSLQLNTLLIGSQMGPVMVQYAKHLDESSEQSHYCDLLVRQEGDWYAYNLFWRSALRVLEDFLKDDPEDNRPLNRRNVLVLGAGGQAQAVAFGIKRREGILSLCAPDDNAAKEISNLFDCRHVPYRQLYETLADVVILTDPNIEIGPGKNQLNPSYFRQQMVVMDLNTLPFESTMGAEARLRQSKMVPTEAVFIDSIRTLFKGVSGQRIPPEQIQELLKQSPIK